MGEDDRTPQPPLQEWDDDALGGNAALGGDDAFGGDAACWLPSLCAECGAMIEGPAGTACWRCGGTRREGD